LNFNGIATNSAGTYLQGSGQVAIPNGLTAFTVYNALAVTNEVIDQVGVMWVVGVPGDYGNCRAALRPLALKPLAPNNRQTWPG